MVFNINVNCGEESNLEVRLTESGLPIVENVYDNISGRAIYEAINNRRGSELGGINKAIIEDNPLLIKKINDLSGRYFLTGGDRKKAEYFENGAYIMFEVLNNQARKYDVRLPVIKSRINPFIKGLDDSFNGKLWPMNSETTTKIRNDGNCGLINGFHYISNRIDGEEYIEGFREGGLATYHFLDEEARKEENK